MELELLNVPDGKIKQLRNKGINSLEDLVRFFPVRYNDFGKIVDIGERDLFHGQVITVIGRIWKIERGAKYVKAIIHDDKDNTMDIVWFNQSFIERLLKTDGTVYIFSGKVTYNPTFRSCSMVPLQFTSNIDEFSPYSPVYSKVKGMSAEYLTNCVKKAMSIILSCNIDMEYLEPDVVKRLGVISYDEMLVKAHMPQNEIDVENVRKRQKVDELFPFVYKMVERKHNFVAVSNSRIVKHSRFNRYIYNLPFNLTEDQGKAIDEIRDAMENGERVDALVQGDVGSGKTVVATAISVLVAENGYQAAIMCPTSVLAQQHYNKIQKELSELGIETVLLVSDLKATERRETIEAIAAGKARVVVGTHAVISKDVTFKNLALTVVDEEHRFGVEQRELLKEKAKDGVHHISMSATPIPRTLALTIYGENTRVINIRTKPAGRKPVQTILYADASKIYMSMYKQIKEGHQCYVICPLIEESDSEKMEGVQSVEEVYKEMSAWFMRYHNVYVDFISGNMKQSEIKQKLDDFANNRIQILISTTIVEVGVDVPNATVILVKNAERFGLAQLHQLRGRVGRGDAQSFCVLETKQLDNERLKAMVATNDGFEIASIDLKLRGSGNIVGFKQSGIDKYVTLMIENHREYTILTEEIEKAYSNPHQLLRYNSYVEAVDSANT